MNKSRSIIILILILALFLGGTVELSEGSKILGVVWLLIALVLIAISSADISSSKAAKSNNLLYILVGLGIIASDILYNFASDSKLGTLDIMTFLFGASLIAMGINNSDLNRMGTFTAYMSATFTVLFLVFFSLFNRLQIDFTHIFDHYLILIPVVSILHIFKVPIEIIGTETVRMTGVEEMSVVIGGPCSGLYSMFLLVGIIAGYARLESFERRKMFTILLVTIVIAYISNLLRVILLYLIGYSYGSTMMMFVHTHLGWVIFTVVAGILIFILNKMAFEKDQSSLDLNTANISEK